MQQGDEKVMGNSEDAPSNEGPKEQPETGKCEQKTQFSANSTLKSSVNVATQTCVSIQPGPPSKERCISAAEMAGAVSLDPRSIGLPHPTLPILPFDRRFMRDPLEHHVPPRQNYSDDGDGDRLRAIKGSSSQLSSNGRGFRDLGSSNLAFVTEYDDVGRLRAIKGSSPQPFSNRSGHRGLGSSGSSGHLSLRTEYDDARRHPAIQPPLQEPFSSRRCPPDLDSSRSVPVSRSAPVALPDGVIQLVMRAGIRVDIALDRTVRVVNKTYGVAISLSGDGSLAALTHPNGSVYQHDSIVEIVAYDGQKTNDFVRYANLKYNGITFTSENNVLKYLLDFGGVRTTTDTFADKCEDYTIVVFFNCSRRGAGSAEEVASAAPEYKFKCTEDGTEKFIINGICISQKADGFVSITIDGFNNSERFISTSPANGCATLTTSVMHCTASIGQAGHLFVKRAEQRIYFDGSSFTVRNGGSSAGFDENNMVKIY